MKKALLFFLSPLALLSSATVQGHLSLGYRFDKVTQTGPAQIETTHPSGFTTQLTSFNRRIPKIHIVGGKIDLMAFAENGFFLNARFYLGAVTDTSRERFSYLLNGRSTPGDRELRSRQFVLDGLAALGWQLQGGDFLCVPQIGGGYFRDKINRHNTLSFLCPFAGALIKVALQRRLSVAGSFYYFFLGSRKERLTLFQEELPWIDRGRVHGIEGWGRLYYHTTPTCQIFVQYLYRRLHAGAQKNRFGADEFLSLETTWISQQIELGLGYLF